MATRVFELAKELGVRSKDILDKCHAEGLDLKNHMAALSAGLEATIREWFSESAAAHSAVETAQSVDLETARQAAAVERKRRRRKAGESEEEALGLPAVTAGAEGAQEAQEVPVAQVLTEEEPSASAPVEEETAAVAEVAPVEEAAPGTAPSATETEPPAAPPVEAPAVAEAVAETAKPKQPESPRAVPNKPAVPEGVKPAGPQVVPRPAKLQGPRVVRVETPDRLPTPQRRPRPSAAPAAPGVAGVETPENAARRRARGPAAPVVEETEEGKGGAKAKRRSPRRRGSGGGRSAAATTIDGIREWREQDLTERAERLAAATGGGLRRHRANVHRVGEKSVRSGACEIEAPVTVKSLSAATGLKAAEFIKKLMSQGVMASANHTITAEMAITLALEYGIELKVKAQRTLREQLDERMSQIQPQQQEPRPPVVTFLGHVDHGKTSLLDRIRQTRVVDGESGGITQHVGSYRYEKDGVAVTFLDTPGHEAFTAMRARGANMTDVVVLVVAADDGIMPQTVEAINHARVAEVPIVVALNKIDVPNANVQRVLGQLAEYNLQPREWGGQTEVIHTSAITGEGIATLLETLSLEAELLELRADPTAPARGVVIESEMAGGRGVVARVLVQDGTLKLGDVLVAGAASGRVRQILNDRGESVGTAGPATPVQVSGLDELPSAGDKFYVIDDITEAKHIAEEIRAEQRQGHLATKQQLTLDNLFQQIAAGEVSELPLIVKADVQGSVEVLVDSLNKLSTGEVRVKIIHAAVGGVSTSDVLLAEAAKAVIVGFHVVPDAAAREGAEKLGVEMRMYQIIYELIDAVRMAMQGLLTPERKEEVLGHAEVRDVFKVSRVGTIAGCYITDGTVQRNTRVRITRGGVVIENDRLLESLKRFKDDVRDVRAGMECGMKIVGYDDVKVGDILEAYAVKEVARML